MGTELGLKRIEKELALELFKKGLPPLVSPDCIPFLFGVSPKLIGAMAEKNNAYYRHFEIPKRTGESRPIVTPRRFLKLVQRWILTNILQSIDISPIAMGFVRGRGTKSHAHVHTGRANVLCVDIENFFLSIDRSRVADVFRAIAFPSTVAWQLSGLCSLDGALPQGAPTSPYLSNIVFRSADDELLSKALSWDAAYSRYADDIVFSGSRRFSDNDVRTIAAVLEKAGFKINGSKTRIQGKGSRKVITGLVVNEKTQPPRHLRRQWRALFDHASRAPQEYSGRASELRGICAYISQFNASRAARYLEIVEGLATNGQG